MHPALRAVIRLLPVVATSACALGAGRQASITGTKQASAATRKIVIVAGGPSHGFGGHDYKAGASLLCNHLNRAALGMQCLVTYPGWPSDPSIVDGAAAVVMFADGATVHPMLPHLATLDSLAKKGVGLGFIHFAVEVPKGPAGDAMLAWTGGYFELGWSVNPNWELENVELAPNHPITRGVRPYRAFDEFYFHMRFRPGMEGVTPILTALPPTRTITTRWAPGDNETGRSGNQAVFASVVERREPQPIMWARERPAASGGGRGFGFTGGHMHWNWANDDQRKLVLNAIAWIAGVEVPSTGVPSATPTAAEMLANHDEPMPAGFNPDSIRPQVERDMNARDRARQRPKSDCANEAVPPQLFTVPDGLEVTLWACAPMVHNPTNIDVDVDGRVWVAEGIDYRRNINRDPGGDRIIVLEDRDGDGRADVSTVFVQDSLLRAPLGIAVIDNKIVVSNAPDLIVYTDVNRNRVFEPGIDTREVILTGFNGKNHDHGLHSVTVGPDGDWYFNSGNMAGTFTDRSGKTFRVASLEGTATGTPAPASDDGHVYVGGFAVRMKSDATNASIIGFNFRNSYEQTITSFGDVFQNDNDDPPACRTTFLLEHANQGFYSRDGLRRWSADRRPGQPIPIAEWRQEDPGVSPAGDVYGGGAPTGIVMNEGDGLGTRWRGLLLSAEAARNTIFGYFPKLTGAGYQLERMVFLTTNKEARFAGADFTGGKAALDRLGTLFRPSDIAIGADGALYVSDWFDPRVGGHQDLDSATAGAIYRIAPAGSKSTRPRIDLTTIDGQVAALRSPAVNVRALGFEALKRRGAEALPVVAGLLDDQNIFVRARAVWLLANLGPSGVARVEEQLRSPDPNFRIVAFRALRRVQSDWLRYAAALAADPSAAVRREVAVALRDVPFAQSRDLLLTLANGYDGVDRTYLEAWGIGATGKEAELYAALAATQREQNPLRWTPPYANLVWRLTPAAAVDAFAARALSPALAEPDRVNAVTALGFIPTRESAERLVRVATEGKGKPQSHALWWSISYKDSRWADFDMNAMLKKHGLYDPEKLALKESIVPPDSEPQTITVADVVALNGNAARGTMLSTVCASCHRIAGKGADYAPDLTSFASQQTIDVVVNSILNPSSDIASGYTGYRIITTDDKTIDGIVLNQGDPLLVQSAGGMLQFIPATRVKSRTRLERSLMLSARQLGLKAQDVADIVAYLRSLRN